MSNKTNIEQKKISSFDQIRQNKLNKLRDAFDRSKKGSLDAPIVDLIHYINTLDNYVTTSSCSGRFAIFCAKYIEEKNSQMSKGGKWIFVEHRTISYEEIDKVYDNELKNCKGVVLFKLEPFVLHVECRTIESAQEMLSIAIQCGFRESGILAGKKIMLGIRTTSNNIELPIYEDGDIGIHKDYLHYLVDYGNKKFNNNLERIHLFYSKLQEHFSSKPNVTETELTISQSISLSPSQWNWQDINTVLSNTNEKNEFSNNQVSFIYQEHLDDLLRRKSHVSFNNHLICIYGGWGGKQHSKEAILSDVVYIQKNHENNTVLITSPQFQTSPPSRQFASIISFKFRSAQSQDILETAVLFGGRSGLSHIYNDCWILNVKTNEWKPIEYKGISPCCRWYSSICSISQSTLILYGGRNETTLFGDCWELKINEDNGEFSGVWTLLYNYNDSQYIEDVDGSMSNNEYKDNKGPGCLFMHSLIPICHSSNDTCNHDEVLVVGGYNNLEGYNSQNSLYVFKISKRYWCDVTVIENEVYRRNRKRKQKDMNYKEDNLQVNTTLQSSSNENINKEDDIQDENMDDQDQSIIHPSLINNKRVRDDHDNENNIGYKDMILTKCTYLCTNTYILYGYINNKFKCYILDLSQYNKDSTIHIYPFPSLEVSLSQYIQSNIVLMQFSLNILDNMLFLSGGGCNLFFTTHYNHTIYSVLPDSLYQYIQKYSSCFLFSSNTTISVPQKSVDSSIKKNQNESKSLSKSSSVLIISDKTKLKTIKSLLEENKIYDKTRKIQSDKGRFFIPILVHSLDSLPTSINDEYGSEIEIEEQQDSLQNQEEKSNSKQSSRIEQLNTLIQQYCHDQNISLQFDLPLRYEFIQDLILFPKQFQSLFVSPKESDSIQQLYTSILSLMNLNRIAVYNDIDGGPVRESHTKVIYPIDADPWVILKQNGILYSYNIEKVMYSKGNCTERLRMKQLKMNPNEHVVDMYAGIGYFTLPILSHPECQSLIALEWNANSVEALKKNLILNHFEDCCTVLLGDNRLTSVPYYNTADRVLMGLLPTSKPGWKTALYLLKPQGGYLHLHENVHDMEYEQFVQTLPQQLQQLSLSIQKPYSFTLIHVEKVKSYAPHVYHYVFDIHATPQ